MSGFVFEISDLCDGCGECASSCPLDIIEHENGRYFIGIGCNQCGICAAACPRGAIIRKKTSKEDSEEWAKRR